MSFSTSFSTVLVANRGEIACRVLRTLRALGLRSVAVYSDADADAPHVRAADEAVRIGPPPATASYLDRAALIAAAERTGAEAVHPGYGFLAESAAFARDCAGAGLVFIGPPPEAIEAMGDKITAKRAAEQAGVPVVPGVHEPDLDDAALTRAAGSVGYPLLVKAAAGGGGKGMRSVREAAELPEALAAARREARSAFGDDALLLERRLARPRHVEIQVLADTEGTVIALGERECSLQRRHQKIIEEAPSPLLDAATRAAMSDAAIAVARACGYVGAGTVEFIIDDGAPEAFYFLEMNTRLQVEHPVTELVYNLDLVALQVRIAAGQPLPAEHTDWAARGHAIEARVCAEDPTRGFLPATGRVLAYREPAGARVDSGIAAGTVIGAAYDPLLAKVVAAGADRSEALTRLDAALAELELLGVTTNVALLRALLADDRVRAGSLTTGLVEELVADWAPAPVPDHVLAAAALARLLAREPQGQVIDPFEVPSGWRIGEPAWTGWRLRPVGGAAVGSLAGEPVEVAVRGRAGDAQVRIGDAAPMTAVARRLAADALSVTVAGVTRRYVWAEDGETLWLGRAGLTWALAEEAPLEAARQADERAASGAVRAPMPGTVSAVTVSKGDEVRAGQSLLVVEAMKMEHSVPAPQDGVVTELRVAVGDAVGMEQTLAVVTAGALTQPGTAEAPAPEGAGAAETAP